MKNIITGKLVIMALDLWMKEPDEVQEIVDHPSTSYREMEPVYNRDGIYWYRNPYYGFNTCWFEADGKAVLYPLEDFRYRLNILNVWQKYNHNQIKALCHAIKQGVATRKQRNIVRDWKEFREIRESGRQARKLFFSVRLKTRDWLKPL